MKPKTPPIPLINPGLFQAALGLCLKRSLLGSQSSLHDSVTIDRGSPSGSGSGSDSGRDGGCKAVLLLLLLLLLTVFIGIVAVVAVVAVVGIQQLGGSRLGIFARGVSIGTVPGSVSGAITTGVNGSNSSGCGCGCGGGCGCGCGGGDGNGTP